MISKTRLKAGVISRDASYIEYIQGTKDPLIGGNRTIGGITVDQSRKGVNFPNVQSAIDDLYTISPLRVGDVLVSTLATSPEAAGQIETLTFSGTIKNTIDPKAETALLHVYGIPFIFNKGTSHTDVVKAVAEKFTEMMNQSIIFSKVQRKGAANDQLEVQFIDSLPHDATHIEQNGITVSGNIDSVARSGYGTWTQLGKEEKFGASLYYYKRIA